MTTLLLFGQSLISVEVNVNSKCAEVSNSHKDNLLMINSCRSTCNQWMELLTKLVGSQVGQQERLRRQAGNLQRLLSAIMSRTKSQWR